MASDANGETVAEPGGDDRRVPPDAEGPVGAEPDAAEAGADVDALLDAADEPAEIASTSRGGVFITLTCGFLVLMCCVMGVFGGGSVLWMRTVNLDSAVERLGEPGGWRVEESSLRPWGADVSMAGPADAAAVHAWLADIGAKPSADKVADCLATARPCTVKGRFDNFAVTVEYNASGTEAAAKVQIG